MTDHELLRRYRAERSEAALATLVQRHLDLVFSTAVRQVSSPELAREVARLVFGELAGSLQGIRSHVHLPSWLYAAARRQAADAIRRAGPKAKAEPQPPARTIVDPNGDATWLAIRPVIDDVLAELTEPERELVLRRFSKSQGLRDLGTALGLSDEAAQKRVTGTLERVRGLLLKRGVTASPATLSATLAAHLVTAAPADLWPAVVRAVMQSSESGTVESPARIAWLGGAALAAVAAFGCLSYVRHAQAAEIRSLRGEERRWRGATRAAPDHASPVTIAEQAAAIASPAAALEAKAQTIAHRIRRVKDWMDLVPEDRLAKAPLLTDFDWIVAVDDVTELDDYDDAQRARTTQVVAIENVLGRLDRAAARRLEPELWQAFRRYRKATGRPMPDEVKDLVPYFSATIDPALLRGYAMEPPQGISYRRGGRLNNDGWSSQLSPE